MTYLTPKSRMPAVEEALAAMEDSSRIILTTHVNADGDGAGSEVALASWLRSRGKEAWIINPTPYPSSLRFLLPEGEWAFDCNSTRARELVAEAELAVVLDTGEVPRIGSVHALIEPLKKVVVDHHPAGPEPILGVSFRDPGACATGELVFDLLQKAGGPWLPEVVRGLYVAILADTGAFRFSNTSPDTHGIVAFLLEKGADPQDLYQQVYGNVHLRKLKLLQASLAELRLDPDGELAWMTVPTKAFQELDARSDDIDGLVDYPRDIKGVEVGLLFRETVRGATKISFRSNGEIDVNALASQFGGGGHIRASGALVERPVEEVRPEVLDAVRGALRGRKGNAGG